LAAAAVACMANTALDAIVRYTVVNDISAHFWIKKRPGVASIGPCRRLGLLSTQQPLAPDFVPDPGALDIMLTVNGE
jgi:2-keto-4-pentenoate hydratase/2-oxohepta-3-ene-1,7-dioic acid hydratase in catechol pathway